MDATETTVWEQAYRINILREEVATLAELTLRYRLCECRFAVPQYYIEIYLDGQRSAAYLGTERVFAHRCFEMLVRNTVTPCTLLDIIEDAKNTHASPLQIRNFMV